MNYQKKNYIMGCIIKNKELKRLKSDDNQTILDNGLLVNHT